MPDFTNPTDLANPRDFVQAGWDAFRAMGQQWHNYTIQYLGDFEDIDVPLLTFETPVDLTVEYGTFTRPTAPTAPADPTIAVTVPSAPDLDDVELPAIGEAPEEPDFSGLVYVRPAAPNRPLPELPSDISPTLAAITVPTAPTITLPTDPVLYDLTFPDSFDVTIPEFTATAPVRNFEVPTSTFAWTYEEHDTTLIDTIKSRLSDMVITGLGLTPAEEAALFDRMRGREDQISRGAIEAATNGLAARGLRQPAGLLARALDRIGIENRQRTSAANRDLTIAMANQRVENIKFALSTAISLEMALVQNNLARNELTLRAAQAVQEIAISLFNARVALHNADVAAFKVEAEVFGDRIRAAQVEADILRTQVEAQKAIGEVNESLVRAFGEKMRALGILVDIYNSQVNAAKTQAEINTQTLEQARLRLQGFEIQVNAWGKEQDAYRTSVEAELGNIRAQEVLGNVYATRVQAFRTINAAYFEQGRFQIETQAQQLERFRAQLSGAQIDSQVQIAAIDARLRRYATQGSVFAAEATVSAAESAAADRTVAQRIEVARLRVGTAQRNLELTGNYALKNVDAQIAVTNAKADIVSQLAASTMSGVNFGASYNGSLGVGYSYGKSFGYSGDTADANPGF